MAEKPTYEALERRVRALKQAESKRNRAQRALRESENRYRELIALTIEARPKRTR